MFISIVYLNIESYLKLVTLLTYALYLRGFSSLDISIEFFSIITRVLGGYFSLGLYLLVEDFSKNKLDPIFNIPYKKLSDSIFIIRLPIILS